MSNQSTINWGNLLKRHQLFSSLEKTEKQRLIEWFLSSDVSAEKEYAQGSIVIREGELGDSIFLIGSGSVRAVLLDQDGREATILSRLNAGDFFGEMALFDERPRAATIIADENCILLEVKGPEFLKLMQEQPEIEFKVLIKLSERLRHTNEHFLAMKLKNVDEKLELFNTKLDAELKVIDASLKASQTVFEQTKIRTDEVIHSAERSRTRLTVAASTIGGFVTVLIALFGFLGFRQLMDLRTLSTEVEKQVASINKSKTEIEQKKEDVEELTNQASTKLNEVYKIIDSSQQYHITYVLLPSLRKAIEGSSQSDAKVIYGDIRKLDPGNVDIDLELLTRITVKITASPAGEAVDYTELLKDIVANSRRPEVKIKAYYTLLANAILVDPEEFRETLPAFKQYVRESKGEAFSEDELEFSMFKAFFRKQEREKRELFARIRELLVTT